VCPILPTENIYPRVSHFAHRVHLPSCVPFCPQSTFTLVCPTRFLHYTIPSLIASCDATTEKTHLVNSKLIHQALRRRVMSVDTAQGANACYEVRNTVEYVLLLRVIVRTGPTFSFPSLSHLTNPTGRRSCPSLYKTAFEISDLLDGQHDSWIWGLTSSTETSVSNHLTPRNITEDERIRVFR
jgi:hypothetical protein